MANPSLTASNAFEISMESATKNGMPAVHEKISEPTPYVNLEYKVFSDSENMYLANIESKYRFPLSKR